MIKLWILFQWLFKQRSKKAPISGHNIKTKPSNRSNMKNAKFDLMTSEVN